MKYQILALALAVSGAAPAVPSFEVARAVWPEGRESEMNSNVRLEAKFRAAPGAKALLRVTATSFYRARLNGEFAGYGPARAAKDFFRVDEWPLAVREGENTLELAASAYNACNYYINRHPGFVQAEVIIDGKVVAATGRGGDFRAFESERISKCCRYSCQRGFAEAYRCGGAAKRELKLAVQGEVRLLDRIAPYPTFTVNDRVQIVSEADVRSHPKKEKWWEPFLGANGDKRYDCYELRDFEVDIWKDGSEVDYLNRRPASGRVARLKPNGAVMLDAGLNDCGFFFADVVVDRPGKLLLTMDEVLVNGEASCARLQVCNVVEWIFEKPGTYRIETFEPYVWRYANLFTPDGTMTVSGFSVRTYKNPETGRARFRASDPALEKIFDAAKETFAQNAVDVFTDCPSRERAGWLCDSFFTGRVNKYLTGNTELERLFLQNYAIAEKFVNLPEGAMSMCYPSDSKNGNFIPNWCMWLIIETEEYLRRSGDRATVDALKKRFTAFVDYMHTFRNSDGLLERLPKWVFIEWSKAGQLVQDVSYPSNMTWAEVLDVMNRLYGMPELAAEAERVRATVRRQSWTGKWFCDNAIRQKDGTLKLSGECTETCQYYAFFFKTATKELYPELWKTLVGEFGPKRFDPNDRTKLLKYPKIWPSNAFIGNYLRLECLAREGMGAQLLDETKGYFLYMAERTGTLWENDSTRASCDHAFASHVAVTFYRDILGVKSIDPKTREVKVEIPAGIKLDWCEGTIPVSPTESVTVRWKRGEKPSVTWTDLARADNVTRVKSLFKVFSENRIAHGHTQLAFEFEGCEAWLIEPAKPAADGRWVWTMEWPTAFADRTGKYALADAGYRWVAFNPACSRFIKRSAGNQNAEMLAKRRAFQRFLVEKLGLAPKCGLIGMSWGGFYSVRYASTYPECVRAIYLDAPLLDFSTLSGYAGNGWKELRQHYPFAEANYVGRDDPYQSVNRYAPIARAKIPMLILYGGRDGTVPPPKNCERFAPAFEKAGGALEICRRGTFGHHPHGVEPNEVQKVVNFFNAAFNPPKTKK